MSEYETPIRWLGGPPETDVAARVARQRRLGLANTPDARFDALARKIVEVTGAPAAMVNFVGERRQYFAGLHVDPTAPGEPEFLGDPGREMDLDHGFCPHVVARRKALVLDDIFAYPRFAGNPVVDEIGVRSYLGAPLIDEDGTVIGTVCAVDPATRSTEEGTAWGQRGLEAIKAVAGEVVAEIRSRQRMDLVTAEAPGSVMIVAAPGLEVLHVNDAHERLFGSTPHLGEPAAVTFPDVANVGVLTAIEETRQSRRPVTTKPVPLAAGGRSTVFAAVPARVPGHRDAVLTLGMINTEPERCVEVAVQLADRLAAVFES